MDFPAFNDNLKRLLERFGKTPAEVADETGITRATLSRYLSGNRSPELKYVVILADYFKVTIDSMLGRSPISDADEMFLSQTLTPEAIEVGELYQLATPADRGVVNAVLKRYKKG